MKDDSRQRRQAVPVLVPMPAERPYTYAVPDGMTVVPGSIVRVPLGPREVAGIVWDGDADAVDPKKLRPISEVFDCPPIDQDMRRFVDWIAGLHAVAARHGGAHAAAGAGGLRPGTLDRGPAAHRRRAGPHDRGADARARSSPTTGFAWTRSGPGACRRRVARPSSTG